MRKRAAWLLALLGVALAQPGSLADFLASELSGEVLYADSEVVVVRTGLSAAEVEAAVDAAAISYGDGLSVRVEAGDGRNLYFFVEGGRIIREVGVGRSQHGGAFLGASRAGGCRRRATADGGNILSCLDSRGRLTFESRCRVIDFRLECSSEYFRRY